MYQTIGFSTIPDMRRMAYAHSILKTLISSPDIARKKVAAVFDAAMMDSVRSKHYKFTDQRMLALAGAAAAGNTKDIDLELYTMMHVLLHTCGRANALPPMVKLRVDPSMSLSEAVYVTALTYIDISKFKSYLPPETTHILAADVGDAVYFMLKDFDRWESLVTDMSGKMSSLVAHIKWKIKMGQSIDQFEKTLILHAKHTIYGREVKYFEPKTKDSLVEEVEEHECGDPLVFTFADRLKAACLPGPKFSFIPLISNTTQEALFASYGPFPTKSVTSAGYIVEFPPYSAMDLKPMTPPIEVTVDDHMLGIMSEGTTARQASLSQVSIGLMGSGRGMSSNVQWNWSYNRSKFFRRPFLSQSGAMTEVFFPEILDIPEVDLIWIDSKIRMKYMSDLLGRVIITDSMEAILYEIARKHKVFGGTQSFRSSIDEFKFVNLDNIKTQKVIAPVNLKFDCIYYKSGPQQTEVKMDSFFAQYGGSIVRPAFNEFLVPPVHLLEMPQPSAVEFVSMYFSLNTYERLMSSRAITICYNAFLLLQFFNKIPDLGGITYGTSDASRLLQYARSALYKAN